MWFFGDLGFLLLIFDDKRLKAMCLSFKMVYQHLLYLLSLWTYWHLKITQGPTRFFNGNFRGCLMSKLASRLQWAETAVCHDSYFDQCIFVGSIRYRPILFYSPRIQHISFFPPFLSGQYIVFPSSPPSASPPTTNCRLFHQVSSFPTIERFHIAFTELSPKSQKVQIPWSILGLTCQVNLVYL